MLDFKSVRPIDAVIAVVAALVIGLGAFLGYSMWAQKASVKETAPASRALDKLVARVRKNPNDLDSRMQLAQTLALAGRDRDAAEQYEAVLKVRKEYVPAISGLGFISLKNKDWKTGERYFRKSVDLLEGNVDATKDSNLEVAYFYLGTSLMEQREYEEAARYFMNALRIRRDASDTHYALAVCFREMDNTNKYRDSLENALLFDPQMPEANYDYGMLLIEGGDKAGGAEHLRVAANAAPNAEKPADALRSLGSDAEHVAEAKKLAGSNVKGAINEARIAVAIDPRNVDSALLLASLFEKAGDKKEAAGMFREVLKLEPQNTVAKDGLKRVTDES